MATKKTRRQAAKKTAKKRGKPSDGRVVHRKGALKRKSIAAKRLKRPALLETSILQMAVSGALREAAKRAIRLQEERGLSVVYKTDDRIVRRYPDGSIVELEHIAPLSYELPKAVKVIAPSPRKSTAR